jgi:hypothetical protein
LPLDPSLLGIIIFVPNQNCSTFQIESGTTESVKKIKIDFFSEVFFLDSKLSHGEIQPLPSWFDTKWRFGLGGFGVQSRHAAHHCCFSFHFLRCVLASF